MIRGCVKNQVISYEGVLPPTAGPASLSFYESLSTPSQSSVPAQQVERDVRQSLIELYPNPWHPGASPKSDRKDLSIPLLFLSKGSLGNRKLST